MKLNKTSLRQPRQNNELLLKRLVLANMLWEDQFYVDGQTTAELIAEAVASNSAAFVSNLAIEARTKFKLRHIPLLLACELARDGQLKAETLNAIIQRPDEMGEFLSIYWKDGKVPIANQIKKGLAQALAKFSEFSLAKWDSNNAAVSVRDVLFLTHAKPANAEQEILFKKIANKQLATPDTWEVALSSGADKAETFTRLMSENALGALAFLRNLRNMVQAGVFEEVIRGYGATLNVEKVLPFRFVAAAKIVPQFEDMLEAMMFRALATSAVLPGRTLLLVDVSGSMFSATVSAKSDLDRFDAAAALAMLCKEVCISTDIYSYSERCVRVAPRRGFALREVISNSQRHGDTELYAAINSIKDISEYTRVIVFTDEQATDYGVLPNVQNGYIINVAAYGKGIEHDDNWTTITGFSEAVLDYIKESEVSTC